MYGTHCICTRLPHPHTSTHPHTHPRRASFSPTWYRILVGQVEERIFRCMNMYNWNSRFLSPGSEYIDGTMGLVRHEVLRDLYTKCLTSCACRISGKWEHKTQWIYYLMEQVLTFKLFTGLQSTHHWHCTVTLLLLASEQPSFHSSLVSEKWSSTWNTFQQRTYHYMYTCHMHVMWHRV